MLKVYQGSRTTILALIGRPTVCGQTPCLDLLMDTQCVYFARMQGHGVKKFFPDSSECQTEREFPKIWGLFWGWPSDNKATTRGLESGL